MRSRYASGQNSDGGDGGDKSSYQGIIRKQGEKGGDIISDVPTVETAVDTMRQQYGLETAENVIPSTRKQLESDIRFDMFDNVNPGFGNGMDNKLYLMDQAIDEKIRYAEPMFHPTSYDGVNGGDLPAAPWKLQRVMPPEKMREYGQQVKNKLHMMADTVLSYGCRSTNLLGDDVGYPYTVSAKDLKRRRDCPFEPIIRTDMVWEHTRIQSAWN